MCIKDQLEDLLIKNLLNQNLQTYWFYLEQILYAIKSEFGCLFVCSLTPLKQLNLMSANLWNDLHGGEDCLG